MRSAFQLWELKRQLDAGIAALAQHAEHCRTRTGKPLTDQAATEADGLIHAFANVRDDLATYLDRFCKG